MPDVIGIAVSNCVSEDELSSDDLGVAGTYRVTVAAGLATTTAVSAALDAFHKEIAIDCIDDFIIWPFDLQNNRILDQDESAEAGSNLHHASSVEKTDSAVLRGFRVTAIEVSDGADGGAEVGHIDFVASSRADSLMRSRDLLRSTFGTDRRLRSRISRLP